VGAKSMAHARSMAPHHTADDISQIKQKFEKIFLIKDKEEAILKQYLHEKIEVFA
jgi:hypothetical protein